MCRASWLMPASSSQSRAGDKQPSSSVRIANAAVGTINEDVTFCRRRHYGDAAALHERLLLQQRVAYWSWLFEDYYSQLVQAAYAGRRRSRRALRRRRGDRAGRARRGTTRFRRRHSVTVARVTCATNCPRRKRGQAQQGGAASAARCVLHRRRRLRRRIWWARLQAASPPIDARRPAEQCK
jgi:hypothetical protein